MSGRRIMAWLVELDVVSPPDEMEETETVTLRFSDVPVRPFPAGDADRPNLAWDNRILEVPTTALDIYADATRLTGSLGTGRLVLSNGDGALNAYRGWAFRGVRVWWGDTAPADNQAAFADFRPMLAGRAETPRWAASATQPSRLEVPVYDRRLDLEADIQPVTFAGDNVGDAGYEGGPEDLQGRPKPLAIGDLATANIPIVWVNPASQTAQVHDGEITAWDALYDRGDDAGLTDDGDLSGSAFDASAPDVGHSVTDLGRGLIRVNQSFGGVVTAGILGAVDLAPGTGYLDTAPPLIRALILRADPAASIGATFAGMADTAKAGLWIAERMATRQAVDMLARCLPGWVLPDPLGTWQVGRLRLPAGAPARTITPADVLAIEPGDADAGRPAWKVTVRGARIYQTHARASLAGDLWDTEDEARLREEWRTAVAEDTDLRDRWWPNVREALIETALRDRADMEALAWALFEVMSVRPDGTPFEEWVVTVEMDEAWLDLLADPGIGECEVRLIWPEEAIDRVMLVMGARPGRPEPGQLTLRLWG